MTIDQLRSWMTQYQQPDHWWLAFPSGTHPQPVTLAQVEQTIAQYPHEKVSVLHVDQAKAGSQEWLVVSTPAVAAAPAIPVARAAAPAPAPVAGRAGGPTSRISRGRRTGTLRGGARTTGMLAPGTPDGTGQVAVRRTYGGIGRLLYFINLMVVIMLVGVLMLLAFTMANFWFIIAALVVQPIGALILLWMRIKNIGWSPWLSLLVFVPVVGVVIGPPAIAFPEGFADKKKLDVAAIVILSIIGVLFVTGIILAIIQPEWMKNPYDGVFD